MSSGQEDRMIVVKFPAGAEDVHLLQYPDELWGPPTILINGNSGYKGHSMTLPNHMYTVPRLITRGAILLRPTFLHDMLHNYAQG